MPSNRVIIRGERVALPERLRDLGVTASNYLDDMEPHLVQARRNRLLWIAIICAIFGMLFGRIAQSGDPRESAGSVVVQYLADRGNHGRFVRDDHYRFEIIGAVFDQSTMRPALALSLIYHESTFRDNVRGALGECGLLQVGPHGQAACHCDCNSVKGQIDCGICWYRESQRMCGTSERAALIGYMTGRCTTQSARTIRMLDSRIRLADQWDRSF